MKGSELVKVECLTIDNTCHLWVSVDDRLPDFGVTVLTYSHDHGVLPQSMEPVHVLGNHRVNYAWYGPGPFQNFAHRVTHWMPLPKPPITT